jgi:hypothetical protein
MAMNAAARADSRVDQWRRERIKTSGYLLVGLGQQKTANRSPLPALSTNGVATAAGSQPSS